MPEKNLNNEPPEMPPPLPVPGEIPVAAAEEKPAEAVVPPPPHAPLLWRTTAYLLDWVLATAALLLLLYWLVPAQQPEGFPALMKWLKEIWSLYAGIFDFNNPPTVSQQWDIYEKIAALANKPPEAVANLISFVAITQTFFFWAFFTITEYFTAGASLGKKICNLRVVNVDYYMPPNFFSVLVRSAWKSLFYCPPVDLGFLAIIGIIDAHVPLFNARRRSWHDMFTRTEVIDARYAPFVPEIEDEDDFID